MKRIMVSLALVLLMFSVGAQETEVRTQRRTLSRKEMMMRKTDSYQIVSDTVENGVRHIVALPCNKVCSLEMQFDVNKDRIRNLVFIGGCNGNLKAIGRLVEGMKVEDAIKKLSGVDCGDKGTSCTDQFAQVLKSL